MHNQVSYENDKSIGTYDNKLALISDQGEMLTYGELRKQVFVISAMLRKGTIALLIMKNDMGAVLFYLACFYAGVVPIIIDSKVSMEEICQYVTTYQPEYILSSTECDYDTVCDQELGYERSSVIFGSTLWGKGYNKEKQISSQLAKLFLLWNN